MSFYNPYMKTPDWGQGISDFQNKAAMILMALMGGGMMPGMEGAGAGGGGNPMAALGATQAGANMSTPPPAQGMGQPGMQPTGGPPQASAPKVGVDAASPQIPPQIMQMLMQMLMQQQPQQPPTPQFGR